MALVIQSSFDIKYCDFCDLLFNVCFPIHSNWVAH